MFRTALLFLTATAALAQESDLSEVVVTATRSELDPYLAPHVVETLEANDIIERQARSVPEALRQMSGISVQKTSNGQGSPYIRGFTGFRTLALIDGVRFNNSIFRDGPNEYWNTIDALSMSGFELVQGQGSVLYGSDAIGGTLNLLTKRAAYESETAGEFFIHGNTFHRYSTAEQSYIGRVETQMGVGGEWGLHLGASLKSFGDVIGAEVGTQEKTGYDEWSYDARLDMRLSPNWELTAAHQYLDQDDAWRTHSTRYGISWQGTEIGSDKLRVFDHSRQLSYLKLSGTDLNGFIDRATITLSYQNGDEIQDRIKDDGKREYSGFEIQTYGVDIQLESDTGLGKLVYGVDYYDDNVDSFRRDYKPSGALNKVRIQGPIGDDSSYDLLGVYLQDEVKLNDRFTLFLGGRYSHAEADIGKYEDPETEQQNSFNGSWDNAVFSARLTADLDKEGHFKLYGGVSQGFRAPNLSDLSRLDIARSGELETPVTDLDPEKFTNFEIGLKASTGKFTGGLAYFYTDINDMIVRRPTGRTVGGDKEVTKANAGSGFIHGVEVNAAYEFNDHWSVFGNFTWLEGESEAFPGDGPKSQREPISKMQPIIANAGVRWATESKNFWVELVGTAASRADKLSSADREDDQRIPPGGTPGYTLLSLRSGWQVTQNVLLLASLENILDEDYRAHGSGSNEPGIGGTFGVKISF
ncbi:MAG: TonB-dependent receptor [Verrucomicrobiaceae bacterium]|nr:TonB-dependent receptor [Verrucomicrobiaceae bacterium]